MPHYPDEIEYSDKYQDDHYEYRHVLLPKEIYKKVSRNKLLSENVHFLIIQEWRSFGVQQSRGWVHYELHKPEPHILLFRRARGSDPQTGLPPAGFLPPPDTFLYAWKQYNLIMHKLSYITNLNVLLLKNELSKGIERGISDFTVRQKHKTIR